MNEDQANYTKVRFKCKKVNFIVPLLNKKHTDPNFLFIFKLCYVSRYLKILESGNLRIDLPETISTSLHYIAVIQRCLLLGFNLMPVLSLNNISELLDSFSTLDYNSNLSQRIAPTITNNDLKLYNKA